MAGRVLTGSGVEGADKATPGGLARPTRGWMARVPRLFMVVVVLPTVIASIYYLFIAAPIYVSEAQIVASVKNSPQGGSAGLGSVLASVGVSAGQEEIAAYEVQNYMLSRNAILELQQKADLLGIVSRPEGDFLYRFPRPLQSAKLENFYKAYKRFVSVDYNLQTGLTTIKVRAFRPGDAQGLAEAMVNGAEGWVSKLNDRALADALTQAERQVGEAEAHLVKSQTALTSYRSTERLIDPEKSATASLELLSRLQIQAATLRAQRAAVAASTPQSPQLPLLGQQIAAFDAQMEQERSRSAGESDSLAPKVATYERLTLERDMAAKSLATAVEGVEAARLDARRQQLFLDRVVNPSLPDKADEPHRFQMIGLIFISCLLAYSILALVIAGLREHQQR
jgi:capsular polysaccharide transport system permease protein